jgi:hypothetical protein
MTSVSTGTFTFQGPYVLEIYDRQGRIVWYHVVPDDLFSLYPAPVRAGTHIWYDAEDIFGFASGDPHILQSTLDGRWSLRLETPNAGQAYAEGPDGSFFYELRSNQHGVLRVDADGTLTLEWDCDAHMDSIGADDGDCLLNGCNWDPVRDTILASQFPSSTVFEIDRSTQQAFRQMGQLEEGDPYTFDPANSMFAYQHWPYWTPEGTLFVSTHACGNTTGCVDNDGVSGIQIAAEYAVDDATQTLTLVSSVVSTDLWATQSGEAYRLPNGNVVQGYGQDGAVREIAPDGSIAFEVYWPRDISDYRAIGHTSFIADLYALNQGPP